MHAVSILNSVDASRREVKPKPIRIIPIKLRIVQTPIKIAMEDDQMETDDINDAITISSTSDVTPPSGWYSVIV